ncbi:MAG: dihydrolipoyl dehydrogenase [Acidobacteriota bacterium]
MEAHDFDFDLIVLGSGPGGYVAAIRAAQLGLSVAVVEKDPKFGGTCLHRGCIPTKALLHTAGLLDEMREAEAVGIEVTDARLDIAKAHAYKDRVVDKNARGIEFLFKKNKITGVHGRGRLADPHRVVVTRGGETSEHTARFVLIATGSVPRHLPFAPIDGERILDSDQLLALERVPRSLAVLGAGAVGTEFASVHRSFGAEVTILEMLPRLLPIEDEDASAELAKSFRRRGIAMKTSTRLAAVEAIDAGVRLSLEPENGEPETLEVEMLLVAVGRAPVSRDLGLEELGVSFDGEYVGVDAWMQTSVPSIYAIGDVVNTPWLAHVASAEGILAVEHMAGHDGARPIDYRLVPSCTYCQPEVASVGLTEAAARAEGHAVEVGKFPFSALGKAAILQTTEGFVKVVRETTYDEVLGVHIVGPHATDLIAEACVALQLETTNEELFRTMHAHPTLSEGVMEAAHAATGHAIHF